MTPFQDERGFSMMELFMVMVIIGVLAVVALPRMNFMGSKNNLRTSTSSLTAALYQARTRAVNDGLAHGVRFEPDTATFRVVRDPLGTSQDIGPVGRLEDGVLFGYITFVNNQVIFSSIGQLEKACLPTGMYTGSVELYDDIGDTTRVDVTFLTGRIRENNL